MSQLLKNCHNFGCNQQFRDNDDNQICVYHSGEPFFHDAYKGWTCCQQKSTDFSTFLNFKGCKTGKHSDIKREKPKEENKPLIEPIIESKVEKPIEEEFDENNWISVEIKETKGLKDSNETQEKRMFCQKCKTSDENQECVFHSGQVIFHETLKYWTCCDKKKFTDFDDFNALKGCQKSDNHIMIVEMKKPREDWFQTDNQIHIILYGLKGVRKQHSKVETNGKTVRAVLKDSKGIQLFSNEWKLEHRVGAECRVIVSSLKVEFILSKKQNKYWNQLIDK